MTSYETINFYLIAILACLQGLKTCILSQIFPDRTGFARPTASFGDVAPGAGRADQFRTEDGVSSDKLC